MSNTTTEFDWRFEADQWSCYWRGMHLFAKPDGRWWVMTESGDICTSSDMQVAGRNAKEAMLRAQRVAAILKGV
jgi:hypothetical protein